MFSASPRFSVCIVLWKWAFTIVFVITASGVVSADHLREIQVEAISQGKSAIARWGSNTKKYAGWQNHTNRLIPVYTFGTKQQGEGIDIEGYAGKNSPYRDAESLKKIYGRLPENTLNPAAEYFDQTNIADIQFAALKAGKKNIFLVVFDGMDWETTLAAAIYKSRKVGYSEGRGTGLFLQNTWEGSRSQFGYMVTSPHNSGTNVDINKQKVTNPGGSKRGGYDVRKSGPNPWTPGNDAEYTKGKQEHAYTDSASSATSMTAGFKTYNGAINVDHLGSPLTTIAHKAQDEGYSVGVVSSVPISHATPAAAYAHNVSRRDYQDISRDMLGLKSISHPERSLTGLDVVIGGGFGTEIKGDRAQGENVVSGNKYLTQSDLREIDVENGGRYIVSTRTEDVDGGKALLAASRKAAISGQKLLGFYGVGQYSGHLPYQTANGDYQPAPGVRTRAGEVYSKADIDENPTLADMTEAALNVLSRNEKGLWLMVEAGDVDWANHDNNLDNSIGAVLSGDDAVRVIANWVKANSSWDESVMIVTADHGHYLVLEQPSDLIPPVASTTGLTPLVPSANDSKKN